MTRKPVQATIECAGPDLAGYAQALANRRLQPAKPQQPCDTGLFSDSPAQMDLVDYINVTARK